MPIMLSSAFSLKSAKNMLVFPNYAKKCASTIEKSLSSIPKATQTIQILNLILSISKHILLPETLTWSTKGRRHDILNFKSF